ncbi:MAG TPA: CHASE3 domain-containing protein [Allocoleopsis sp.]
MSQNTVRLSKIVPLGFGFIFLLMIGIGFASKFSLNKLAEAVEWQTHTYIVKTNLQTLEKELVDAETGQRGFIFTGHDEYLEPYNNGKIALSKSIKELKELIKDNPEQVKNLEQVEELVQKKIDELTETISLKRAGKEAEVKALVLSGKGKIFMDEIRQKLIEMLKIEDDLLLKRTQLAKQSEQLSAVISMGGTVVALVFGSLIIFFISDQIIRPINQVASVMASSSTEIAATIEQQERSAVQQSVSVNQTTTTMDELGVSSQQSATQAEAATEAARQALSITEGGSLTVEETLEYMTILKQKVQAIAAQIEQLTEQSNQISNISGVVTDLANQTNMLALNAAVEAVRAGENGKGFSVIATEIRKLADQSKKSTEQINNLVISIKNAVNSTITVTDEGMKTVESGSIMTKKTAEAFSGVTSAVNHVLLNNQQISQTAQQQAIAIQQVVEAMNVINRATKETAIGINQSKSGIQQLNQSAQNLNSIV